MDSWVETKQLPVHFVSAAGLVWKDGKVLLIRSQRRGWEIPGGVVEQRLRGYRRALAEYGVPFDPGRVFAQEITVEEGKRLGHALSRRPEITGICASADILAAGIMAGLSECGVAVPAEKSVVGFDDHFLARLTIPGLTTIHQDAEQKGVLATDMLLKQLRHEPLPQKRVILPVRLVERGSVRTLNPEEAAP